MNNFQGIICFLYSSNSTSPAYCLIVCRYAIHPISNFQVFNFDRKTPAFTYMTCSNVASKST